jgi:tetratricopeptide (TPR) repeat protein
MTRIAAILLCGLSLPTALAAQAKSTPSRPAASSKTQIPAPSEKSAPDNSKEPFVIENYSTTARFENDGTGEQDLVVRAKVQSDAGAQLLHELVFRYDSKNQQMDVRYLRVRKSDGTVANAAADAAKDTAVVADAAYAQLTEKHISVPPLAPGDTLEYDISTRLVTPYAPGEFWFAHSFVGTAVVRDERLEISVPGNRKVILKSSPAAPFETAQTNGRTIYRWHHVNMAVALDDSSKGPQQTKAPDVQLTTFASWEAVGRWYAQLQKGRSEPTDQIRAKASELTREKSDTLAKAQALYDYVATNIRSVDLPLGQAGWQPHSAAEIFANTYGDSADKNVLLAAMLQAVDIAPETALIPFTRALDKSVPSPAQLDHAITAFPLGNETIWMDPTTEVAPFRLLASPLRNKAALLVTAEGPSKIVETPANPPFVSSQHVDIDGGVSDLGKLTARAHYSMRGDTELVLRLAFHRTPQAHWNELAQTILSLDGLRGEVTAVKPGDPADTHSPFELDIDFKQSGFLDWASKRQSGALPLLAIGMPDAPEDAAKPIDLGSPLGVDVKLKLVLPDSLTAHPPVASSVSRDYAEFKSSYRFAEHVVTAERSLDFKLRSLPADRADDYKEFARAVAADQNRALVIINTSSGDPAIPVSATPDDLVEAGLSALNTGNAASAAPLFNRAVELDPKQKQAWNDLGLSDLRLGKTEDAAAAFRKQLELNPADEHANDYLGLALERQNKNDEAAAAFRRQTEIDPLDAAAHAALGEILLAQRDFAHAAPELDKATILTPDNAELRVSLGRALLNVGDKPRALAAFEKAAALAPTPPVWNDIAFNLAGSKVDLDKAQQYAERAIHESAANFGAVDLQHVTQAQLQKVSSIAAYWDTLGWVYFQKGDFTAAERYIRAAWILDQNGEIGDHLAQVYEKRGEKDRAIKAYALALAAPNATPDTRARLTLLLGSNSGIDDIVATAAPELAAVHTIEVGKLFDKDARGDFFIALSPGEKTARVDSVRFISGSEQLRPLADKLRSLNYGEMFPSSTPMTIIRRGTLSCSAKSGDCALTLVSAEDAQAR